MTPQEIRGRFQEAIRADPDGSLVLDASLLSACGVDRRLVSALSGGSLVLRRPTLGDIHADAFTLEGDAELLGAGTLRLRGEVRGAPGGARATLRAALGDGWSFRRALPDLPREGGPGGAGDPLLHTLSLSAASVVLASHEEPEDAAGPLDAGLNFAATAGVDGALAFLRTWGIGAKAVPVAGTLDLSGAQPFAALSLQLPLALHAGPVTLGDAYLGVFWVPAEHGAPRTGMELDLAVGLGGVQVQLRAAVEAGGAKVALEGEFEGLGLANLARLAAELGVPDLSTLLPPGVASLPLPELRRARVSVDLAAGTLDEIELEVASPAPWPLVGELTLDRLAFLLRVTRPLAAPAVHAEASGRFQVAPGSYLYLRGAYPDFSVWGGLEEGSRLSLSTLLANPAFHLPPVSIPGDPAIEALGFSAAPGTGVYDFHVEVGGDWPLGAELAPGVGLTLRDVVVALHHEGRPSGRVVGRVDLLGVPLVLSAALPSDGGAGLVLEGGTLPGADVSLRQLAGSILAAADLALPSFAGDVLFRDLSLRADTRGATRGFVLNGASSLATPLPLPGGDAPLHLSLGLRGVGYDFAAKRFGGRFEGRVSLDDAELSVVVELGEEVRTASFAQGDAPLDIGGIVSRFVPGGVVLPPELPGIEGVKVAGLRGSFDLRTHAYTFTGTATVERFTAGSLAVAGASGSVELRGTGSTLEALTIKLSAGVEQSIVPELHVASLALELSLARAGEGWKWHVGGSMAVRLLGLPALTLAADVSDERFAFTAELSPALAWSLPDVVDGSFRRVAMELRRDAAWKLEAEGSLKVASLPRLSGKLGLRAGGGGAGFAFVADEGAEPLTLAIPLVPGVERMTVGGSFLLRELSLAREAAGWEVQVASRLQLLVPRPSAAGSDDPADQALELLGRMLGEPVDAVLAASREGVWVRAEHLPRIPVPVPVLVNGQLVTDRMGKIGVDSLEVRLGSTLSVEGMVALSLPEEVNNIFGERDGRPVHPLLNREIRLGMSVDSTAGLGFEPGSSIVNLEAAGIFTTEVEGSRTYARFTLGALSFRFDEVRHADGKGWWHFDFGDFGEIAFLKPRLSFNGASFAAAGGFHVIRDLRLPTAPVAAAVRQIGMGALADGLPAWLPLLDIHLLHDDGAQGKRFHPGDFLALLERIRSDTGLQVPVEALRPVVELLGGQFNHLPSAFRDYLDVTIPKHFEFDVAFTPSAGFGLKLDVRAPEQPVRLLLPTGVGFQGITLRRLALGELLSGNLLHVEVDAELDSFDLVSLAAALVLPEELTGTFTHTEAIQRRLVLHDVVVLVILSTGVPIPVPVWFKQVGVLYYGLEGARAELLVNNNLAGLTLLGALKGLLDVYRELRAFFGTADHLLPADLFARNGLNAGIGVAPGFLKLPPYVGGQLVGNEGTLFEVGIDEVLVAAANFVKHPDPGKLLRVIPLEHRNGVLGDGERGVEIGPFRVHAAWLFSTLAELEELARRPAVEQCAFVKSLSAGGEAGTFVGTLRDVVRQGEAGAEHDGLVLYLAGAVALPGASLAAYAGVLADRGRGALTQFRVQGTVGSLVGMDVGGLLAARVERAPAGGAQPRAELMLEGHARLDVFGRRVLDAEMGLLQGVFTFHDRLSLFPPGFGFRVDAEVEGEIARDHLRVHGAATVELPFLPMSSTRFELTYDHALVVGTWRGQEWTMELSRTEDRYRFQARGVTPLSLLPGFVELAAADDPTRGPMLALAGPASPVLELAGGVSVPPLRSHGSGVVLVAGDRVEVEVKGVFMDRFRTSLALRGDSLDHAAALAFRAEMEGDLFQAWVAGMKAGFDAILAEARTAVAGAKQLFDQEWTRFTRLVDEGYNAVRAGILQAKHQIESVIQAVSAQLDAVLGLLHVNDDERAARHRWIQEANERARAGVQWFEDQVRDARLKLEGRAADLARLDAEFARKSDWDRFWEWAGYQITRLRLVLESELLPRLLAAAEEALRQARTAVPFIAEAVDAVLQQLDAVRNALYDELERLKQHVMDRKAELDHYNSLLLLKADELLREFGRTVDTTARDAAQKAYDAAQGALNALQEAGDHAAHLAAGAFPFEVDRLAVHGTLGTVAGTRFTAEADVYFNIFPERRLAAGMALTVDFDDLAGSAAAAARLLWEKRDQIRYLDQWELWRRESMKPLDAQVSALRATVAAVGPQFGESWQKKVLYDMDWVELAHFYEYAKEQVQRFPVLARVLAVVENDYGFIIENVVRLLKDQSPEGREGREAAMDALRYAEHAFKSEFEHVLAHDQIRIAAALAGLSASRS